MSSHREKAEEDDANTKLGYLDQDIEQYDGNSQPSGYKHDECNFCPGWLPPLAEAMEEDMICVGMYTYNQREQRCRA